MSHSAEELIRFAPGRVRERARGLRGQVTHRERRGEVDRARVREKAARPRSGCA